MWSSVEAGGGAYDIAGDTRRDAVDAVTHRRLERLEAQFKAEAIRSGGGPAGGGKARGGGVGLGWGGRDGHVVDSLGIFAHRHAVAVEVHPVGGHVKAGGRDDVGERQVLLGERLVQRALEVVLRACGTRDTRTLKSFEQHTNAGNTTKGSSLSSGSVPGWRCLRTASGACGSPAE